MFQANLGRTFAWLHNHKNCFKGKVEFDHQTFRPHKLVAIKKGHKFPKIKLKNPKVTILSKFFCVSKRMIRKRGQMISKNSLEKKNKTSRKGPEVGG